MGAVFALFQNVVPTFALEVVVIQARKLINQEVLGLSFFEYLRELKRGHRGADGERGPSKTLQDAIDGSLDSKPSLKELTLTNYRR